jgi:hypothetical protein
MRLIIKILGYADGRRCEFAGQYLKEMHFEDLAGFGRLECVSDRDKAKVFGSVSELHAYYNTIPKNHPIRSWRGGDNRPNKPLTAFNLEIIPL